MNQLNLSKNYKLNGAYIELTSTCNLRCLHCYNESGAKNDKLTYEAFMNIINGLPDTNDTSVTLSGGEPLLHPLVWDYISELEQRKFGKCLIITNATSINDEVAQRFKSHRIGIQLSINGSCAETHDRLCGEGSFEKTMAGLKCLLRNGIQKRIVIRCMVSKFNYHDIYNILQVVNNFGIEMIEFAPLTLLGRSKDNVDSMYLSSSEKLNIINYLENDKEVDVLRSAGLNISVPGEATGLCPLILSEYEGKEIPLTPRIDPEGNVFLCQLFTDINYSVGNIYDYNIDSVIKSEQFSELIWFLRFGSNHMHSCKDCVWQSVCGRGCLALNLSNGSIQETDGECSARKKGMLESYLNDRQPALSL